MANCAIYEKGTDRIVYFIKDCVQTGRDFQGSNGSATGVKEYLFDVKWTEDVPYLVPIKEEWAEKTGELAGVSVERHEYDKRVTDLRDALTYRGRVVSSADDVDRVTRDLIAEKYPINEELKAIRLKEAGDETAFNEYHEYVDALVKQGRAFKESNFPKEE